MSNNLKVLSELTVGTSAVQVDQRGQNFHKYASVSIQADPTNTGTVYVGDFSVSSTHYARALSAGDFFTISGSAIDATKIYVIASAAGQIIHISAS